MRIRLWKRDSVDITKYMVLVKGEDKTEEFSSVSFNMHGDKTEVVYENRRP